jgi:hypothetical protein
MILATNTHSCTFTTAQSGRRGFLSPGSHNTPQAGPHGALPPDGKGAS